MATPRRLVISFGLTALLMAGCSMPHVMGLGSYYTVTDETSGKVYYTDNLKREKRGSIEFRDGTTGAWISLAGAQVQEISEGQYKAGIR